MFTKEEEIMRIFEIYQTLTDKIPDGFSVVEVRSIGYKHVWLRRNWTGKYGGKPKQFKKIDRQLWDRIAENKYFKEVTNKYKEKE